MPTSTAAPRERAPRKGRHATTTTAPADAPDAPGLDATTADALPPGPGAPTMLRTDFADDLDDVGRDDVDAVRAYLIGADTGDDAHDAAADAESVVDPARLFDVLAIDPREAHFCAVASALERIADEWAAAECEDDKRTAAFRFVVNRAIYTATNRDSIGGSVSYGPGDIVAGFATDEETSGGRATEEDVDFLPVSPSVAGAGRDAIRDAVRSRAARLRRSAARTLRDAVQLDTLARHLDEGRVAMAWPGADLFAPPAA